MPSPDRPGPDRILIMTDTLRLERRLGYRLLRWVLALAIASGALLGTLQILVDAHQVSRDIDRYGAQTRALITDSASQAIFSLDEDLAHQVLEGLSRQRELVYARISHSDGEVFMERSRPLATASLRTVTDLFFGSTRIFQSTLDFPGSADSTPIPYGELYLEYDTWPAAKSWTQRSLLTLVIGVTRALLVSLGVYLLIHWLLTRPLSRFAEALTRVDPEFPDRNLLIPPKGHQGDELDLCVRATNNLLVAIEESQQRQVDAEERAYMLTRHDRLTGLPTRDTIMAALESAIAGLAPEGGLLGIYCCGIDDFKSINEQLGYQSGDQILQALAGRLQQPQGNYHTVAGRLSGDQFVFVVSPLEDKYEAEAVAESLLALFNEPLRLPEATLRLTATIGVALYPEDTRLPDHLLQLAEHTMTLAKTEANNHFRFYVASIDQEMRERRQLERDLSIALDDQQLYLVYQPQVNLQSGRIVGVEALLRWHHPERGLIPPDQFIPLAELNGDIVGIGEWVLNEACRQAAAWAAEGLPLRVSVNLSAVQLRQPHIVGTILDTLSRHQIAPGGLELEITETSFMENIEDAINKLRQLASAGLIIAVDDFGTGYSSLSYLKRMPIRHLKIDRQFVTDLLCDEEDTRIANTIIDLGRSLNLSVIAEGVETPEQECYLAQRGCQMAQGYYFSKPLLPEELVRFVADFHHRLDQDAENETS